MIKTALRTLLLLVLFAAPGFTAEKTGPLTAPKQGEPPSPHETALDDPLGRSTPLGTVIGFMKAVDRQDYERAVEYLDTRQPPKRAQVLARELQFILDRGLSASLPNLSKKPEGDLGDMLAPNREKIGVVKTESGSFEILLDRIQKGNDPPVWLFSSQTLRQVPEIFDGLGTHWAETYIPKSLLRVRFMGYPVWRWIAFIVGLPLLVLIASMITRAFLPLLGVMIHRFTGGEGKRSAVRMKGPIRILVLALALNLYSLFSYALTDRLFWSTAAATLATIGLAWLFFRLVDVVGDRIEGRSQGPVASGRIAMTRLVSKLSKGLIAVMAAVIIFYRAGFNFTAVLTGLGVGGIAIAFAAQKTIENLFGGVMIISDQPLRVGDFCRAGEYRGVVEDIGLRSTRLRTLDRTVVFVPNGQITTLSLENFTMRDKILFNHRFQLRTETSPKQLQTVIVEMRRILREHPKVEAASFRVRFTGLKDSSFEVEVFAYILETGYEAFLEVQEGILLRMVEAVEAGGTAFAFPYRALYFSRDMASEKMKNKEATEIAKEGMKGDR